MFQFLCPEGHLLEGDENYAGRQSQCPQCGTVFVVPGQDDNRGGGLGDLLDEFRGAADIVHAAGAEAEFSGGGAVHIPCPNGHELETPMEMIGLEVLCPYCKAKFKLRNQDSFEFKRQQAIEDAKRSRLWFNIAVVTATAVVLGLLVMMIVAFAT